MISLVLKIPTRSWINFYHFNTKWKFIMKYSNVFVSRRLRYIYTYFIMGEIIKTDKTFETFESPEL